ncbi:MAG TPA: hypothetical protein VI006_06165 [Solirubrobacteraceae bacterium]
MRAVAAAALLALAWPSAAEAADYGGGGAGARVTLLTVRTRADGTATVRAVIQARCGVARAGRPVTPAAEGSFAFTATARTRTGERGVRQIARVTVAGRLVGSTASGTATARISFRGGGRVVERCASGRRPWQARAAAAETVAGAPRPNGAYQGLTSQTAARPRALVLRVDATGRRVTAAAFQYRDVCESRAFEKENLTPGAAIAADGSFRLRERFTLRFADATERFRVRVDGRFTPAGVNGTLSVTSVARSPGGAVFDRCATGRLTFAGAL